MKIGPARPVTIYVHRRGWKHLDELTGRGLEVALGRRCRELGFTVMSALPIKTTISQSLYGFERGVAVCFYDKHELVDRAADLRFDSRKTRNRGLIGRCVAARARSCGLLGDLLDGVLKRDPVRAGQAHVGRLGERLRNHATYPRNLLAAEFVHPGEGARREIDPIGADDLARVASLSTTTTVGGVAHRDESQGAELAEPGLDRTLGDTGELSQRVVARPRDRPGIALSDGRLGAVEDAVKIVAIDIARGLHPRCQLPLDMSGERGDRAGSGPPRKGGLGIGHRSTLPPAPCPAAIPFDPASKPEAWKTAQRSRQLTRALPNERGTNSRALPHETARAALAAIKPVIEGVAKYRLHRDDQSAAVVRVRSTADIAQRFDVLDVPQRCRRRSATQAAELRDGDNVLFTRRDV
ncbi:hypothetical protein WR25_12116 [Diploscapter pachys]|uniref:Uncharacterized protein n=1 Tax=Diploscapter pachys TaxID=2018661 RepID=A0A2A2JXL9_9BILA|nr:hypothetical protein WR25_12116 [Diploscapter pachys]